MQGEPPSFSKWEEVQEDESRRGGEARDYESPVKAETERKKEGASALKQRRHTEVAIKRGIGGQRVGTPVPLMAGVGEEEKRGDILTPNTVEKLQAF